jgi:hypothetical protein
VAAHNSGEATTLLCPPAGTLNYFGRKVLNVRERLFQALG